MESFLAQPLAGEGPSAGQTWTLRWARARAGCGSSSLACLPDPSRVAAWSCVKKASEAESAGKTAVINWQWAGEWGLVFSASLVGAMKDRGPRDLSLSLSHTITSLGLHSSSGKWA